MAIDNGEEDCGTCLGHGQLEVCPLCGSTNIGDTGPDGCEHELPAGTFYGETDCPDCDGTGDAEADEEEDSE